MEGINTKGIPFLRKKKVNGLDSFPVKSIIILSLLLTDRDLSLSDVEQD